MFECLSERLLIVIAQAESRCDDPNLDLPQHDLTALGSPGAIGPTQIRRDRCAPSAFVFNLEQLLQVPAQWRLHSRPKKQNFGT